MTKPTYYECGICDHWHSAEWDGDCRQDDARFFADQLDTMHGTCGWDVIDMEDIDEWRAQTFGEWWSSSSGKIEIRLPIDGAEACHHSGPCDADVLALSRRPEVAAQIAALDPALIATELKEYGAWDAEQLADHAQNVQRLLWIAACDIAEQTYVIESKSEHDDDGRPLYWQNADGWGPRECADVFTTAERVAYCLPIDGRWELA